MRILAIILASLCLVASAGLGFARSNTNFKDAKEFDQTIGQVDKETLAQAKQLGAALGVKEASLLSVKPSALRAGGVGMIVVGLLSALLLIAMFVKKGVPGFAAALVAVAAVTVFLNPQYETGGLQATSARNAALIIGALAAAGALFAFAADRLAAARRRRVTQPAAQADRRIAAAA